MFEKPINLATLGHGSEAFGPLHQRVVAGWKNPNWAISYHVDNRKRYNHMLATDSAGYMIGATVFGIHDGVIFIILENPSHQHMTSWSCPYKGWITSEAIIEKMEAAIEIFETEEIPDPADEEEDGGGE